MRESTRGECATVRGLLSWPVMAVIAGLAWVASAAAAPASRVDLKASGAVPLHAVTVAGGTGFLLGTADQGPGVALTWWFPIENPDEPIQVGFAHPLASGAREWGVAVDDLRGAALVHWRSVSGPWRWAEIEADGSLGVSGALELGAARGRHVAMGVRVAPLAEGWLAAVPTGRSGGRAAEALSVSWLGAAEGEPLVVEGRLLDLAGGGERAWLLRWDEASGALELGLLVPSVERAVEVERWLRLDTLAELGTWGVILSPIDEPVLAPSPSSGVITPIDRPIDWGELLQAILNPIEEPERLRTHGGAHLGLLPAGGLWQGLAAWRADDGVSKLALFDSEGQVLVQSLPDSAAEAIARGEQAADRFAVLRVAVGGQWVAWQALSRTGVGPLRLAGLTEHGLGVGVEAGRGLLLSGWETSEAVALLTAELPDEDGRDLAIPSKPMVPIGIGSPGLRVPSKPVIPIGIRSTSQKPISPIEFNARSSRTLGLSQKPIIPVEFEAASLRVVLHGLSGAPGEPIELDRLSSIDLDDLAAADGTPAHALDLQPDGEGAWLLRRVQADGVLQFAFVPDLSVPAIDGWWDLSDLVGARSFPIRPPNEPPHATAPGRAFPIKPPSEPPAAAGTAPLQRLPIDVRLRWLVLL